MRPTSIFRKMIPDIEALKVACRIFIIDERDFLLFFGVNYISQEKIIVTKHHRTLRLL